MKKENFKNKTIFEAAVKLLKLAKKGIIDKSNAYLAKCLFVSVRTIQRIIKELEEMGFLKRYSRFENGEQIQNLIKINISFSNDQRGDNLSSLNTTTPKGDSSIKTQETNTSFFGASKSDNTKDKIAATRRFEKFLRNSFIKMKDKLKLSVNNKEVDFIETSGGLKLMRINKKIIKKETALQVYNFLNNLNFEKYLSVGIDKLNEANAVKFDISKSNGLRIYEI